MQHEGDLTDIRHTHDFAELIMITQGGGLHWIDGTTYPVSAGDIFLIQGRSEHYFLERHNLTMYNIMFDEKFLHEHLRSLQTLPGFNGFFLLEPTYRQRHQFQSHLRLSGPAMIPLQKMLRQMTQEATASQRGFDLMLLAKLLEILVLVSREYAQVDNQKAQQLNRLGEVLGSMETHYTEKWTLKRISRMASMAPSTLLPIFRRITGFSPIDYLLHIRLEKAAQILRQTDLPISEIARKCGFPDSNYFSRQFKKCYSHSPREWR